MKKPFWVAGLFFFTAVLLGGLLLTPNPLSRYVLAVSKANGYLAYTPDEATALAYNRCGACHGVEKVLQYCSRCGPPFVVVAQAMKKYIELSNLDNETVRPFHDAELIAIVQVWNALVGNWEGDWRPKDIKKMLMGDRALIRLVETSRDERPIEVALKGKIASGSYKEIQSFGKPAP